MVFRKKLLNKTGGVGGSVVVVDLSVTNATRISYAELQSVIVIYWPTAFITLL